MELYLRILLGIAVWFITFVSGMKIYQIYKNKAKKPVPDEDRIDVLRKYSEYEEIEVKNKHYPEMELNHPVPEILHKYDYSSYCNRNGDEIVFSMLDFVCDHFKHYSHGVLPSNPSLVSVVRSCEENEQKTNCRGLSLILSELLRINGIRARHVTCKPYEEPFRDCHVVVDCLMPSGSRIMLDPTYRLYFTDGNGEYVSLRQLREAIIAGKTLHPNKTASYNGTGFNYDEYIEYMSKNLLRLNTNYRLNDTDSISSQIELIPKGYSTKGYSRKVQYTTSPEYFWNIGEN
ncbi:transglutaminase-like domain-containing protein [Ruminococcus albus]|uniref:transglutaminase-like domain-containing protein n=1 Tax=Ruminococcus albus TaxID=1264 RepID=UPI0004676730|nr:transglutaminase-like domain-containing protein [Ruminococcus albus]